MHEPIDPQVRIVVYDSLEVQGDLRRSWDALLDVAEPHSRTSGLAYVQCAWAVMSAKDRRARLAIIAAWRGESLVGVWPLCVNRRLIGTVVDHLGDFSSFQYAGPVLRDDPQAAAVGEAMFDVARGLGDVLQVQNLRSGTAAHAVTASNGGFRRYRRAESPVVRLRGVEGWDEWVATKSKSFRQGLRADRRRLAAKGEVAFVRKTDPQEARGLVDWLVDTKQAQLKAKGLMRSHLWRPELRAVLHRLAEAGAASGAMFYALTLDGVTIAAGIYVLGCDVLEYYYSAIDPDYAEFSVGNLLIQDGVTLAIQHGRDFDFRLTREAYKLRWAPETVNPYESFYIACSPIGRVAVVADALWLRADHLLEKAGYR